MPKELPAPGLLSVVTTTRIKFELLEEISRINAELSKTKPFDQQEIQKYYPILCKVLPKVDMVLDNKLNHDLLELLKELKEELSDLDEVTVNVPDKVISKLSDIESEVVRWARESINPKVVVSIQPAATITAGLSLSYQGHYKDITLDKILHNMTYDKVRL